MYYKCCIDNCQSMRKYVKLHQFPLSKTGVHKWLLAINSDRLWKLSIEELRNEFVCHKHFEAKFITTKNRIRVGVCPSLFTKSEVANGVPDRIAEKAMDIRTDHCYFKTRRHEDHTYYKSLENAIVDDHCYTKKKLHEDHTYCKVEILEIYQRVRKEMMGYNINNDHSYSKKRHYDHTYVKLKVESLNFATNDQRTEPDTFSELQRHDETELPDTGDLDDNEETGVVVRRCGKAEQNPYAGGISDCYDYDHGMILTSLDWQDSSPAQDPVFSWEKRVEEVPTGDDDVVVSLEHKDALQELPAEISLYCEDELNSAKVVSDQVPDYQCNECEEVITGFRYTCVQCADWDLCAACEARSAHDSHYVLRVPGQRPYSETQAVLAAVRQQILSENLFLNPIDDSLKIEIKSESDDTPIDPETGAPPDQDLRDFDPLPVPDPIGEQRPDSQNSFTDSSEESESDDDADGSPSRNETLEDPDESFSQTDHPHVQISSDESDVSCSPPRKRKCETPSTYTVIGQIQPTPCTETQREPVPRYAQLTKVDAHQVPKEILAKSFSVAAENTLHARPVALIEAPAIHHQRANHKAGVRKKPTSILIQEPQENIEVSTESAVHKLRMTVPHTLNRERPRTRASEKLELSSQESLIYTTDYQIEAVVESEPSEILPEDSERLLDNQPEFYLRLPADTNEESLIQALQSQVYVRLQRDS